MINNKKYRFYYHYNKPNNSMTIHFKKECIIVKNVICKVNTETKWYDIQPRLRLQGFCEDVIIEKDKATII